MPVPIDIKLPELTEQLSEFGADMLVDCIRTLPRSLENAQPQSTEGVTYGMYNNQRNLLPIIHSFILVMMTSQYTIAM